MVQQVRQIEAWQVSRRRKGLRRIVTFQCFIWVLAIVWGCVFAKTGIPTVLVASITFVALHLWCACSASPAARVLCSWWSTVGTAAVAGVLLAATPWVLWFTFPPFGLLLAIVWESSSRLATARWATRAWRRRSFGFVAAGGIVLCFVALPAGIERKVGPLELRPGRLRDVCAKLSDAVGVSIVCDSNLADRPVSLRVSANVSVLTLVKELTRQVGGHLSRLPRSVEGSALAKWTVQLVILDAGGQPSPYPPSGG